MGFGFVEIGTVTPLPQAGNEKPRFFRLPKDKALINRMGFNNDGVKVDCGKIKEMERMPETAINKHNSTSLSVEILAKTNHSNEDAWKDYEICFKELHHYVDYFVVNVSIQIHPA